MKKILLVLFTVCAIWLIPSCNKEDITGKKLLVICEELPPYNYAENGELKGITVDIVAGIMQRLDLRELNIELTTDWDAALNLMDSLDNVALFTTGLTSARKDKYQWVGPVTMFADGFIGLKSSGYSISTISDAKELASVGVVTGYATTEILEDANFGNLVYYGTLNEAMAALYGGTLDAVFNATHSVSMIAAADGFDVSLLTEKFIYKTTQGYIAFSRGVSQTLVANWQEKLDELKAEGFVQDVYDEYLPGIQAPGVLTVYSYENPTLNYRQPDGSITGSSYDMVAAMMSVTGVDYPITFTTFADAVDQAKIVPNSMNFSTLRSIERESQYRWIGPICKKNYCFYIPANSTVTISNLDDARQLASVGVTEGWAAVTELENLGFTNLQTWPTPEQVFRKLMDGSIDAAVLNDISIRYLAEETGYAFEDVTDALFLSRGDSYIAFSLDTQEEYFQQWQQAYNTIVDNGRLAEIWDTWYPDIDW
jgi:polar amino acid transport system substrate-binding protein